METSRLMTAPALSGRVRPATIRSRSLASTVRTHWTSAFATSFE